MSEKKQKWPPLSTFATFEVLLVIDSEDWVQDVSDKGFPEPGWSDGKGGSNYALLDSCEDAYKHATSVEPPEGYRIVFLGNQRENMPAGGSDWLFSWEEFEEFMGVMA